MHAHQTKENILKLKGETILALIDFDILIYSSGFASQKSLHDIFIKGVESLGPIRTCLSKREAKAWIDGDDSMYIVSRVEAEPLVNALHSADTMIDSILKGSQAVKYTGFISGENNFREKIATIRPYKGNRDPEAKPVWYKEIKEFLIDHRRAVVVDGMEADDAIAIKQMELNEFNKFGLLQGMKYETPESIICTIDKDLDQIPGWHYNWRKKERYWVDVDSAIRSFYLQLIAGDPVDNIQGVPGVGVIGADKALEGLSSEKEYYEVARRLYNNDEALLENAHLLYIRKHNDDVWQPPT